MFTCLEYIRRGSSLVVPHWFRPSPLLLFHLHLTMNIPNFVPNTAINNIFRGSWEHERISRLNVAACPTTSCVLVRGRAVAYPSTLEMVQWVYNSATIRDNQIGFLRNLVGTDQLWVESILAHRTLLDRTRNDVVLPIDMSCLLEMGLYNPHDPTNTPPHVLSHAFRYAASLSVAQLQLFNGLINHLTVLQNDVTYNVKILKEESEGHLKVTRDAVSSPLFCGSFCYRVNY
jgi:hypothetical protein